MAEMSEGQTNVEPVPPERLELSPCGICGRTFAPQALDKHERVCEKQALKRRKPFDSLAQRVAGTDLAPFHMKSYLKPKQQQAVSTINEKVSVPKLAKPQQCVEEMVIQLKAEEPKPVIQSTSLTITHEPTPKRSSTSSVRSGRIATPAGERCPHCDRSFNSRAYDRHVEWCKEHQARAQAQPSLAAVQMAKERLEARTKYRAPLLAKTVQKAVNREKYSPSNTKTGEFQRTPSIRRDSSADSKTSSVTKSNFQRTPSVRRNNSFDEERKETKVRRSPSLRRDSSFEEDHNRGNQRTSSLRRDSSFEERNSFKRIPSIRSNNSQDRRNIRKESPASRHKDESHNRSHEDDNDIIDGRQSNKPLSSISSPMLSDQSLPCNTPQSTNIPILKRKKSKIGMKLPQSQINDTDVNQLAFGMNVIQCQKPRLITWKDTVRGKTNTQSLRTENAKINYTTPKDESNSISLDRNVTYIKDDELDPCTENNGHENLTYTKYDSEHFEENDFQKHTPDELLFGNIGDFRNMSKETITISSCHRFRTSSEILSESDFSLNAMDNACSKQSCDYIPEHLQSETLNSAREKKKIAYYEQKCGNSSFVCENLQMNVTTTLKDAGEEKGSNYECSQRNVPKKLVYKTSDEYDRSCGDGLVNDCYRNSENKRTALKTVNDQSDCTEQMNLTRILKDTTDKLYDAQTLDISQYLHVTNNSFNKSNNSFKDSSVNNADKNVDENEVKFLKNNNQQQPQINVTRTLKIASNKFDTTRDTQSCNSDKSSRMIYDFDDSHHDTKNSQTNRQTDAGDGRKMKNQESRSNTSNDSRSDMLVFGDIKSNYFKTSQQLCENKQLDAILDECDYFIENFAQSSTGKNEMEKSVDGTCDTIGSLYMTNNSDSSKKHENDMNLTRSKDNSIENVFVPLNSSNLDKNGEEHCQSEINKKSENNFEPSQGMSSTNCEDTEGSFDPCFISGIMPLEKDNQFDTSERKSQCSFLFDSFCITKHSFQFNDFFSSDVKHKVKKPKSSKAKKTSLEGCQTPEKYTSTPVKDSDPLKRISSEGIIINESCIIPEKKRKITVSDLNDSVLIIDSSPISENFERFVFDNKDSFEIYEDTSNDSVATTSFKPNWQNSKGNENFVFGKNSSDNSFEDTADPIQNWKTSERLEYKTTLSTVYESDLDKKDKNSSDDERKTPSPIVSVNNSSNDDNSEVLTLDLTNVTNESKVNDTVESGNVSNAETNSPKRSWKIPENSSAFKNECADNKTEQLFTIYEHVNMNRQNIKSDASSSDHEPDVKANCKRCNSCTNIGEKSMLYNKAELENSYQVAEKERIEKLGHYACESEFIDSDGYIFTTGALLLEESFNDIQNGVQITEVDNERGIDETNEECVNRSFSVEDKNPTQCGAILIDEEQTNLSWNGMEDDKQNNLPCRGIENEEINKIVATHYKNDKPFAPTDDNISIKTHKRNKNKMNIPTEANTLKSNVASKVKKVKKTKSSHTKLKASFSNEMTKSTVILPTLGINRQNAMLKKIDYDMTNSVVEKLKRGLKKDKLPPLKSEYDPFVSAERQLKELFCSDAQRPLTTATKEPVQQSHRPNTAPTNQLPVVNQITKHASGPNLSLPVITTKVAFGETSKNNKNINNQKINSKSNKKIISKKPNNQLCNVNVSVDKLVPNKNVINFDEIPIRTKNTQNVATAKLSDLNRSTVSNTNNNAGTISNNLDLRNSSNSEFTKNENSKNSNRSSIIEPPKQFEDRLKSLQSNFELIENFINDNYVSVTSKDDLISNGNKNNNNSTSQVFDDTKSEFDVSVIDPALINSVDNLSIPAELKSDNDIDHYSIQYDKQISTLEPFVLTKTEMNFKRTTYDSDSVGDDFDFEGFMSSFDDDDTFPSMKTFLHYSAIPENKALPTSASLNSSVLNQPTEKSPENMKSPSQFLKRSISLLDPVAKPKTMKNKSDVEKYFGDKVDKQKTSGEDKIPAEELFGVGDELYEEYKKYEELFLQEKKMAESRNFNEESMSNNMIGPGGEQSSPEEMSSPEKYHSVKPSGDSAYSSLNRATPKPLPRSQQHQQRLRNRPSVESDRCPSSSGSDVSLPPVNLKLKDMDSRPTASERRKSRTKHVPDRMQMLHLTEDVDFEGSHSRKSSFDSSSSQRMSKFCHECGSKFPVSAAKFCVECGVKRLVL